MKIYFAPMEGVTGYIYRMAHHTCFGHVDKYYAPFIAANQSTSFKTRELKDILPDNNQGLVLIPQILTNHAGDFIQTSRRIKEFGYEEINLNLGCPSGTVVAKKKGAGFLAYKEELNLFLEKIFTEAVTKISIKTRLGMNEPEEFYELMEIYNQYPIEELTIHARVQKDFYQNKPNWAMFGDALKLSKNKVCYNGDIFTVEDFNRFTQAFPEVERVMLGRGLIANPALAGSIRAQVPLDKKRLREFHDRIFYEYQQVLSGDRNVLFKMKEVWFYMIHVFSDHEKYRKKLKKSQSIRDYENVVKSLFAEQEILEDYQIHNFK